VPPFWVFLMLFMVELTVLNMWLTSKNHWRGEVGVWPSNPFLTLNNAKGSFPNYVTLEIDFFWPPFPSPCHKFFKERKILCWDSHKFIYSLPLKRDVLYLRLTPKIRKKSDFTNMSNEPATEKQVQTRINSEKIPQKLSLLYPSFTIPETSYKQFNRSSTARSQHINSPRMYIAEIRATIPTQKRLFYAQRNYILRRE